MFRQAGREVGPAGAAGDAYRVSRIGLSLVRVLDRSLASARSWAAPGAAVTTGHAMHWACTASRLWRETAIVPDSVIIPRISLAAAQIALLKANFALIERR